MKEIDVLKMAKELMMERITDTLKTHGEKALNEDMIEALGVLRRMIDSRYSAAKRDALRKNNVEIKKLEMHDQLRS